MERNVEALIGHFVDASWAYRFGPPAQDAIVVTLEDGTNDGATRSRRASDSQPAGPWSSSRRRSWGSRASCQPVGRGCAWWCEGRRLVYQLRLLVPGFTAADNSFSVEPGGRRTVALRPVGAGSVFSEGSLTALNLAGTLAMRWEGPSR
jgi:beta-mannosidase